MRVADQCSIAATATTTAASHTPTVFSFFSMPKE